MPVRPDTTEYSGLADFRRLVDDVERLKRGEFWRTPAVDSFRIGRCLFTVTEGGTGTLEGLVLTVTNIATGQSAVLAALP